MSNILTPLTILWVQSESQHNIDRLQELFSKSTTDRDVEFVTVEDIEDAFNYFVQNRQEIGMIVTEVTIPWGKMQFGFEFANHSKILRKVESTQFGGPLLIELIVKHLRRVSNFEINEMDVPVLYMSAYYRERFFTTFIKDCHAKHTYEWLHLLDDDELLEQRIKRAMEYIVRNNALLVQA